MPIYEYQCKDCDHQFEKLQKISDDPLRDCPSCTQPTLVKLISAAGFQLKGTGWYATDFKNSGRPSSKNSNSESSGSSTGSDSSN